MCQVLLYHVATGPAIERMLGMSLPVRAILLDINKRRVGQSQEKGLRGTKRGLLS